MDNEKIAINRVNTNKNIFVTSICTLIEL